MAINLSIYSNGNTSSKTVTVDFIADYLASSANGVSDKTMFFFKFNTSARDTNNNVLPVKIVEGLDDLVLNGEKQRVSNSASNYGNVKSMIVDYVYDYIYGHDAGLYATGVTEQLPMKFN